MMKSFESLETVYIISLECGKFASIYTLKNNIIDKKINRADLFMCFNCVCNLNV